MLLLPQRHDGKALQTQNSPTVGEFTAAFVFIEAPPSCRLLRPPPSFLGTRPISTRPPPHLLPVRQTTESSFKPSFPMATTSLVCWSKKETRKGVYEFRAPPPHRAVSATWAAFLGRARLLWRSGSVPTDPAPLARMCWPLSPRASLGSAVAPLKRRSYRRARVVRACTCGRARAKQDRRGDISAHL